MTLPSLDPLAALVLGRERSLFGNDLAAADAKIDRALRGRRVLIVGGGGSIGAATTRLALRYRPQCVHVVDASENYLAELVRDLRSSSDDLGTDDFRTLPIDYGSPIAARLLADSPRYDVVMNFAALKHVRSEKDVYSVLQMLDTNVLKHVDFKQWLREFGHHGSYFAVSTDKAANPSSLMGASKRLMEDVVFDVASDRAACSTSARFANVAFSNGSLLQSFLIRLDKRQPLAVPRDTRRYFIAAQEAGEICLLAALGMAGGHVAIPRFDAAVGLQWLHEIAERVLSHFGYRAVPFDDETEARHAVDRLATQRAWPLLMTPLDTSGEKPYEEFVGAGEAAVDLDYEALQAIVHRMNPRMDDSLIRELRNLIREPRTPATKPALAALVARATPTFHHVETGRGLDERV